MRPDFSYTFPPEASPSSQFNIIEAHNPSQLSALRGSTAWMQIDESRFPSLKVLPNWGVEYSRNSKRVDPGRAYRFTTDRSSGSCVAIVLLRAPG